jgi:hypothetical protein
MSLHLILVSLLSSPSFKVLIYGGEYKKILAYLISQLGEPSQSGPRPEANAEGYYIRNTEWSTGSTYARLNMIFGGSTYRIRLTLYWKD